MITFNKIVEIFEQAPGIHYVRFLMDFPNGMQESAYIKIKKSKFSTAHVMEYVDSYIHNLNHPRPLVHPQTLSESLPSVIVPPPPTFKMIWGLFRAWFRRKLRRNG